MKYYPIFLHLRGKRCVVVGGGEIARRKVEGLLAAGARVTVVSPNLVPRLRRLAAENKLAHRARRYRKGDLKGCCLAYGATGDGAIDRRLAAEARRIGVLLNVVDQPELCGFISPAIVKRGDLTLAISTGGASPALAKKLRQELERRFGAEYAGALKILRTLRAKLDRSFLSQPERARILTALARSPLLRYVKQGKKRRIQSLVRRLMRV